MTIREAMKAKGLTDQALADRVGVHRAHITRIRQGERQPSLPLALKLSAQLGLKVDAFLTAA